MLCEKKVISDRVRLKQRFWNVDNKLETETRTRCRSWKTDSGTVVNRNYIKQHRSNVKIALLQVSQNGLSSIRQNLIETEVYRMRNHSISWKESSLHQQTV